MRFFARLGFPFSPAWDFREQSEWVLEQSPSQIRPLSLIAEEAGYLVPQQRALRPSASAPA